MYCKKCGGNVYHDNMYVNDSFIDLSCLMCGKRWHVDKKSVLGKAVLDAKEKKKVLS